MSILKLTTKSYQESVLLTQRHIHQWDKVNIAEINPDIYDLIFEQECLFKSMLKEYYSQKIILEKSNGSCEQ